MTTWNFGDTVTTDMGTLSISRLYNDTSIDPDTQWTRLLPGDRPFARPQLQRQRNGLADRDATVPALRGKDAIGARPDAPLLPTSGTGLGLNAAANHNHRHDPDDTEYRNQRHYRLRSPEPCRGEYDSASQ